jgi:hypothetical protein
MQVSPFAQYFVRKLLRQYFGQSQSLGSYVRFADPSNADLWRIVSRLYGGKGNAEARVYELESLIGMYSQLESRRLFDRDELDKLEQQIIELLGLRLGRLLPATMPQMLPEQSVRRFRFYDAQQVREGMVVNDQFYGLVQDWNAGGSLHAYRLAWALAHKEVPCIMTRSPQRLSVWVHLRSRSAKVLMGQGPVLVQQLLTLYPVVCRMRQATVRHPESARHDSRQTVIQSR